MTEPSDHSLDARSELIVPTLSAPTGGGAVRGIADTFRASAVTGTGATAISLGLPAGRGGFGPALALQYASGGGNGPVGLGWSLDVPRVARKTARSVPRYDRDDVFAFAGGDDLILVSTRNRELDGRSLRIDRFRPRAETHSHRIERWTDRRTGATWWRTLDIHSVESIYGTTDATRIHDPDDPGRVFAWLLEEQRDVFGNRIAYQYKAEDLAGVDPRTDPGRRDAGGYKYLKRVQYGNRSPAGWCFEVVFDYGEHVTSGRGEDQPWTLRSDPYSDHRAGFELRQQRLCRRVLVFHHFDALGPNPQLARSTELVYDEGPRVSLLRQVRQVGHRGAESRALPPVDLEYSPLRFDDQVHVVARDAAHYPQPGSEQRIWVDLDGDGLPGILESRAEAWYYHAPAGGARFRPPRVIAAKPSALAVGGATALADFDGDGRLELVQLGHPGAGYYPTVHSPDGWQPHQTIPAVPNLDLSAEHIHFVDVTGDGRADLLVRADDVLVCYRSEGRDGFRLAARVPVPTDERRGPAPIHSTSAETIHFADMTGDGLSDLVRVGPARLDYWPNLGHGRFGRRFTMPISPPLAGPDEFDGRRVRLVDVDGSGTTDLVYLGSDGAQVRLNEAGNTFSPARRITALPPLTSPGEIDAVDLLGNGTACLVWSTARPGATPGVAYVDLAGGTKPYLLTAIRNNTGGETRISYRPSTELYLEAKTSPRPWQTRLSFPVHVVERIETIDHIAETRSVRRFLHHDGWFDPDERELVGFGLVETWDADDAGVASSPPVHTETRYHLGRRSDPAPVLAAGLAPAEESEALFALRGRILREEIRGEDASPSAVHPYLVRELTYEVRRLAHRVFVVLPRGAVEVSSERDPTDPRVRETRVLEVDDLGSVRRSLDLTHPRSPLYAPQPEQLVRLATLVETDVAHQDDDDTYRVGVAIASRRWEVIGGDPSAPGALQLRQQTRRRYYSDDLAGPLALGHIGRRALLYDVETLALTTDDVLAIFHDAPELPDAAALLSAGYRQDPAGWWAPSGRAQYDAARYYRPTTILDPFGHATTIDYDADSLLVERSTNPLGHTVVAHNDYLALSPWRVVEASGTTHSVAYDPLGLMTRAAVSGAFGEGDTLASPTQIFEYQLDAWRSGGTPTSLRTRERVSHGSADTAWEESVSYYDGSSRTVMVKTLAEPGDRWVGTGRTIYDGKSRPLRKYEPYFSAHDGFELEASVVQQGVSKILYYDALGRLVRVSNPDGTERRTEHGAWRWRTFDESDLVDGSPWQAARLALPLSSPERRAAILSAAHHGTPGEAHLDGLGRTILTVADNGPLGRYSTRVTLDIDGRPLRTVDPRGNVSEEQRPDRLGRPLYTRTADGGARWALPSVDDRPVRGWDELGRTRSFDYDALRRPTDEWVSSGGLRRLRQRTIYGEALNDPLATYHLGRPLEVYDSAGVLTMVEYDFRGRAAVTERRFAVHHDITPDWTSLAPHVTLLDVRAAALPSLETTAYQTVQAHDALGRVVSARTPDGTVRHSSYGARGLLAGLSTNVRGAQTPTVLIASVTYDAHGRRTWIAHGNGVQTAYRYDPLSLRLIEQESHDPTDGRVLQSIRHTYDAAGRIVETEDGAQPTQYFANAVVPPTRQYEYDALGRLVQATGREHAGQQPTAAEPSPFPLPHFNDAQAIQRYRERYEHDEAGNLTSAEHRRGGQTIWHRHHVYQAGTNRLTHSSVPGDPPGGPYASPYGYDAHGNMLHMPHLPLMAWDERDHLQSVTLLGGGVAYYVYDGSGTRVRKVVEHLSGVRDETRYLGEYEVHRRTTAAGPRLELHTAHVFDDHQRVAMFETTVVEDGVVLDPPPTRQRRILPDHLGSTTHELDEHAQLVTYREYHPFGGVAFAASALGVPRQRYGYCGKERDEETGLDYFGARYYAPWLARWTAADPKSGSGNLYAAMGNDPVNRVDPDGRDDFWWSARDWKNAGKVLKGFTYGAAKAAVSVVAAPGLATYYTTSHLIYTVTGASQYREQAATFDKAASGIHNAFAEGRVLESVAEGLVGNMAKMADAIERGDAEAAGEGAGGLTVETLTLATAAGRVSTVGGAGVSGASTGGASGGAALMNMQPALAGVAVVGAQDAAVTGLMVVASTGGGGGGGEKPGQVVKAEEPAKLGEAARADEPAKAEDPAKVGDPAGTHVTYGKNEIEKLRKHSQHIRETARELDVEIPKSPGSPETQLAMRSWIERVVREGITKRGPYMTFKDAIWTRLGDGIVVRRPNGEFLTYLDYRKGGVAHGWDNL